MKSEEILNDKSDREEIEFKDHEMMAYRQVCLQISHDLRTPAAVLRSNLQLLNDFKYSIKKDSQKTHMRICQSALEKMIDFLDKIQLLNTLLNPNLKPSFTQIRIRTLIDQIFNDNAIKENTGRIKVYWNLKHPELCSDYHFLRQIILHLLSNALKFSTQEVQLIITNSIQQLTISIKDKGIGIPAEDQKYIFNPFYRAKNAQLIEGSGMGLAVVSTFAKCLDAGLYLSSKVEYGTTVKIVLRHNFKEFAN